MSAQLINALMANLVTPKADTECLRRAAETVARANNWDTPKYLGEVFNWPLQQRNEVMQLSQKLKVGGQ